MSANRYAPLRQVAIDAATIGIEDAKGRIILEAQSWVPDAAVLVADIVRAVNAHDDLLAALDLLLVGAEDVAAQNGGVIAARAAIAKAKGGAS